MSKHERRENEVSNLCLHRSHYALHHPRHLQFFQSMQIRVLLVLCVEVILPLLLCEALQGEFAIQNPNDDLAHLRLATTFYNHEITLEDAGIDHAIAFHSEEECT